jgi:hypothetical protein
VVVLGLHMLIVTGSVPIAGSAGHPTGGLRTSDSLRDPYQRTLYMLGSAGRGPQVGQPKYFAFEKTIMLNTLQF